MPLIVVGGQASKIGKTSVVTAILRRFSEFPWTAVKTTPHRHRPSRCELVVAADEWRIWKQISASSDSDTGRFLAAGAKTALLLQAENPEMSIATAALQHELAGCSHVIVESSRIVEHIRPDLFLMLLSVDHKDEKPLSDIRIGKADILLLEGDPERLLFHLRSATQEKAIFRLSLPIQENERWMDAIAEKIGAHLRR